MVNENVGERKVVEYRFNFNEGRRKNFVVNGSITEDDTEGCLGGTDDPLPYTTKMRRSGG